MREEKANRQQVGLAPLSPSSPPSPLPSSIFSSSTSTTTSSTSYTGTTASTVPVSQHRRSNAKLMVFMFGWRNCGGCHCRNSLIQLAKASSNYRLDVVSTGPFDNTRPHTQWLGQSNIKYPHGMTLNEGNDWLEEKIRISLDNMFQKV